MGVKTIWVGSGVRGNEFQDTRLRRRFASLLEKLWDGTGPSKPLTRCCSLMHSSLVVTTDGLPLGLAAVKFWTRKQFKGLHRVELRGAKGRPMTVTLELRYRRMNVLPPIGKQNRYPALQMTVLHAQKRKPALDVLVLNGN